MSLQRTPPGATLISASEGASGSVPNLSTYGDEDIFVNLNSRKRKDRTEIHDYKNEFSNFRKDIIKFLEDFGKTQTENLTRIHEEISEIKNEIGIIKSTTENFSQKISTINEQIEEIKSNYTITQDKIKNIETEISEIKNEHCTENHNCKSLSLTNENIFLEMQERHDRARNIVIVGIPEKHDKNYNSRQLHDNDEVMKTIKFICQDSPKPIKTMRLGKYIPNNNRLIKVCFNNTDTPKYLLRNKTKLPKDIQIYSDQTPSQKRYLQYLKGDLNKRIENGEKDLIIKYIKGIPTIVTNKPETKN